MNISVIISKISCFHLNCSFLKTLGSKPMVPFIVKTLELLVRSFYARFIKKKVLLEAKTVLKLVKVDINDQKNLVSLHKVDLGFVQISKFKHDVCAFLTKICCHMIGNSYLSNFFATCMRSLAPAHIEECMEICEIQFEKLLSLLVSRKKSTVADSTKSAYSNLVNVILK